MGSGPSAESRASDGDEPPLEGVVDQEYGFRVHRVEANSPGDLAGLQSILDYVVVANGKTRPHRRSAARRQSQPAVSPPPPRPLPAAIALG